MDRTLDEAIADRQRGSRDSRDNRDNQNNRGQQDRRAPPRRTNNYPRDGVRKPARPESTNLESDWVHDRYDDDERDRYGSSRNRPRQRRDDNDNHRQAEAEEAQPAARLRVENLHYDITETELQDLFSRIAPVELVKLVYDRAGRSNGTAFISYASIQDARAAIREYDGANAKGQPIRLELLAVAPAKPRNNPFDRVENPRSLFDRVEAPRERRARSASPGRDRGRNDSTNDRGRRSDVRKQTPDGIDRYVPGRGGEIRSSSHREGGRRAGERRERGERGGGGAGRAQDRNGRHTRDNGGRLMVDGRPRKTQTELDAEMDDYWGQASGGDGANGAAQADSAGQGKSVPVVRAAADDDIDMIE